MNYTLVQNMDFLEEQAMHVQSETMQYKAESDATICTKGQYLQVNLSVQQCIQTGLVGGMPQPHVKMFLQGRTHSLIQDEEQEKSVNGPLLTSIMRIMTIIKIVQKYRMKYPNSAVEGLV